MVLDLRDICKSYMQGKEPVPVLHHIQLQVEEGEYLAIMGPSGSGICIGNGVICSGFQFLAV